MNGMEEIQLQLESMHAPAPAYFVQSYLDVGEIYDGTGPAFQISYDERPQIRFEFPAGIALSPGDAMQFSMDSDAAYFCTVASIERQSDAAVALAMPDPALWNEYRPADALAATPRVHYVYQSERYDTIVPTPRFIRWTARPMCASRCANRATGPTIMLSEPCPLPL